jgi:type IV pilus assembly protein PilQ
MNYKHNRFFLNLCGHTIWLRIGIGFLLFLLQMTWVKADELALQALDFSALSGDKLQLQLKMNGPAEMPKVFQTDNPARIALDFTGVKSDLKKKMHPINVGVVGSVYAIEAAGRLRVVINLLESVPFETKLEGNSVFVTLKGAKNVTLEDVKETVSTNEESKQAKRDTTISKLLPKQTIKDLDFRRGPNGEGRILISLSNPNTVVDAKEKGGKVILNFLNTTVPKSLLKKVDVADYATPVRLVEVTRVGSKVRMTITPRDGNYEYSSFQTDGLLTVEFRPLTAAQKEQLTKQKFPFSGEKLSLNFQDIEVRSVLQILADFTDINIIAADSVGGSVTLRLNDVPWDQALALILKSKGLAKRQTGNVILVAPFNEISKIEKEELEAQKVIKQLERLKTEYIQVNYAKAENFRSLLLGISTGANHGCSVTSKGSRSTRTGSRSTSGLGGRGSQGSIGAGQSRGEDQFALLSKRGTAIVDARTNTLIVKDTVEHLEQIRDMIALLDIPVRQVLIEARIVIAQETFSKELGVEFGLRNVNNPNAAFLTRSQSVGGLLGEGLVDLAQASPYGQLTMTLLRVGDYLLNLKITASQDEGKVELLSNPRLLTSDRCEATIKQGQEIPFETVSQNGTNTELIEAVLELKVTPQITPNGSVIMDLHITKNSPTKENVNAGQIGIDKREIQTSVLVNDGDTVVLGGVFEGNKTEVYEKVPWFADLPGLGWLFTHSFEEDRKNELLIFITPKIVKGTLTSR